MPHRIYIKIHVWAGLRDSEIKENLSLRNFNELPEDVYQEIVNEAMETDKLKKLVEENRKKYANNDIVELPSKYTNYGKDLGTVVDDLVAVYGKSKFKRLNPYSKFVIELLPGIAERRITEVMLMLNAPIDRIIKTVNAYSPGAYSTSHRKLYMYSAIAWDVRGVQQRVIFDRYLIHDYLICDDANSFYGEHLHAFGASWQEYRYALGVGDPGDRDRNNKMILSRIGDNIRREVSGSSSRYTRAAYIDLYSSLNALEDEKDSKGTADSEYRQEFDRIKKRINIAKTKRITAEELLDGS